MILYATLEYFLFTWLIIPDTGIVAPKVSMWSDPFLSMASPSTVQDIVPKFSGI